ncbi:N-acetyltransferase [Mycolicibacterium sp. P1-18]|uniref:GNAT family N-acetyltransferase n=1 Tax=Mycolicibacterium sp. P1-18 TaxID=2024615 RepID=UPI0011F2D2AF|nr:GNAT family N-acetyltransferase [Mycolicibacterium sp. P1-18]KAA0098837.1 N-acetyltransferase [Mycolicibacterium sp. P1-18]
MTELTDKTGAPVQIARAGDTFTVEVDGQTVGLTRFVERADQRVFVHTEVEPAFGGRGLATVLIAQAFAATRADGRRIVALCPMVAAYVKKHHDFDDLVDHPTRELMDSLR